MAGRGAYNPLNGIIYWAQSTTGNLIRFDTVNNVTLAPLAVAGATSLYGCVYNPANNFLYSIDLTGGNNTIRKINYTTGGSTVIVPGDVVSNDLIYSPAGDYIFFSSQTASTLTRVDTADVVANGASFAPQVGLGLSYADVNSRVVVGLNNGVATVVPASQAVTKNNNANSWQTVSYGKTSTLVLVSGTNVVQKYDPVGNTFAAVAVQPTGSLNSGGFSFIHNLHFIIEATTGICYFYDDLAPMGTFKGFFPVGGNPGTTNTAYPVPGSTAIYVPSTVFRSVNIFK